MSKIMGVKSIVLILSLLTLNIDAKEDNRILEFILPSIEVCSNSDEESISDCKDISRSELPNLEKEKIYVLDINEHGMVKAKFHNKIVYIHQSELELENRSKVSEPCLERYKESSVNKQSYATHGLMEKCNNGK